MKGIRCAALFLASLTLLASGVFGSVEKSYATSSLTLGRKLSSVSSVSSKSGKKSGKGTSSKKSKSGKKSGKKGSSKGPFLSVQVTPSPVQVTPSPTVQVTPSPTVQVTPSPVQVTPFPDDYVAAFVNPDGDFIFPTSTLEKAVAAYVMNKETWNLSFDCGDGIETSTSCGERYGYVVKR
jgi:hypothetical protein